MTEAAVPRGSLRERFARLVHIDARSLAAFRIAFGLMLMLDVLVRLPVAELFYSNDGWLTNHFAVFSRPDIAQFSLLFGVTDPVHVKFFMVGTGGLALLFVLGYRLRVVQPLLLLAMISVHARNHMVVYGFDVVTHTMLIWTLFLPLESRWSLDARWGRARSPDYRAQLACTGVLLQITIAYVWNGLSKSGETWLNGDAVHYLFWQDSIARGPALLMREHAPLWMMRAMSHATLIIEMAAPLLLWSVWRTGLCRGVALASLGALHLGIFFGVNVGLFSPGMVSLYLLFVGAPLWERLAQWAKQRPGVPSWLPPALGALPESREKEPSRTWADRLHGHMAQAACALWMGVVLVAAWADCRRLPEGLKPQMPRVVAGINEMLLISQSWTLFAPDAPTEEGLFVVEALTADRRVIDPYRGGEALTEIPPAYGGWLAQEWIGHSIRMRKGWFNSMRPDFERRLWRYHEITGDPNDYILGYKAYNLHRPSPKPGEREAAPAQRTLLYEGRRPGL